MNEVLRIDERRDKGYDGNKKLSRKDSRRRRLLLKRLAGNDPRWEIIGDKRGQPSGPLKSYVGVNGAYAEILKQIERSKQWRMQKLNSEE